MRQIPNTTKEAEAQLVPRLTTEFFDTLTEAIRTVGWLVDISEVIEFHDYLRRLAGLNQDVTIEVYEYPGDSDF